MRSLVVIAALLGLGLTTGCSMFQPAAPATPAAESDPWAGFNNGYAKNEEPVAKSEPAKSESAKSEKSEKTDDRADDKKTDEKKADADDVSDEPPRPTKKVVVAKHAAKKKKKAGGAVAAKKPRKRAKPVKG